MRRTERKLTDVEIIDTFDKIVDTIINNYEHEVPESFRKESRAAWIGYKIQKMLLDEKIIETGKKEEQRRLKILEDGND